MNWTEKKGREKEGAGGEGLKSWQKKKSAKTDVTLVSKNFYILLKRDVFLVNILLIYW